MSISDPTRIGAPALLPVLRGLAYEGWAMAGVVNWRSNHTVEVGALVAVHGPRRLGMAQPLAINRTMFLRARHTRRQVRHSPVSLSQEQVTTLARALDVAFRRT